MLPSDRLVGALADLIAALIAMGIRAPEAIVLKEGDEKKLEERMKMDFDFVRGEGLKNLTILGIKFLPRQAEGSPRGSAP